MKKVSGIRYMSVFNGELSRQSGRKLLDRVARISGTEMYNLQKWGRHAIYEKNYEALDVGMSNPILRIRSGHPSHVTKVFYFFRALALSRVGRDHSCILRVIYAAIITRISIFHILPIFCE